MPEPVLYMRGLRPPLLDQLTGSEQAIKDLKAIAKLSEEKVTSLRKRLGEAKGFLDPKSLRHLIKGEIDDSVLVEAIARALRVIEPSSVDSLLKALDDADEEKESPFEKEELEGLKKVLPQLIVPFPALGRFKKAERLAQATGDPLEKVELICDLRPIFNETRDQIEGMMPYTRLRLVATGADGLPKCFEVELSRQQVSDIAEKAEKAKQKIDTLVGFVQGQDEVFMPELALTQQSRKEGEDA